MLSIIIPTYKRNDLLSKCLDCLKVSLDNFTDAPVEFIITDDSPDGEAKSLIESNYVWAKWVAGPKKGPASNRNSGARHAQYDWLIFIDDDCLPSVNLITAYYLEIKKGVFRAFEGAIDADRPKRRYDEQSPINMTGGNFWSCNICLARPLFDELKGFDENFPYAALEDTDLHIRVKKLTPIKFIKEALVIHPWRRTPVFKQYKTQMASYRYFDKKHPASPEQNLRTKKIKLFIGFVIFDFKDLAKYSFRGYKYYLELAYIKLLSIVE